MASDGPPLGAGGGCAADAWAGAGLDAAAGPVGRAVVKEVPVAAFRCARTVPGPPPPALPSRPPYVGPAFDEHALGVK